MKGPIVQKDGKWSKPPPGHQLLNIDASFLETTRTGAVGIVVRDDTGSFVGAACKKLSTVFDEEVAEAIALREGLLIAKQLACHRLIVHSDCAAVVEAYNSPNCLSTVSCHIVDECRELGKDFGKILVQLCNRESNSVADELAKYGRDNPPTLWCDVPPDFLVPFLVNDVTVMD